MGDCQRYRLHREELSSIPDRSQQRGNWASGFISFFKPLGEVLYTIYYILSTIYYILYTIYFILCFFLSGPGNAQL